MPPNTAHEAVVTSGRTPAAWTEVSVVVPVFDEEACLPALYERLTRTLSSVTTGYEILFVDDGSRDRSLRLLRQFARSDSRVRYCSFSRNFGHEAATSCGLEQARGDAVVLIDADLQDPPELIADMYALWREGYEVIYARRESRDGESWFTKFTSYGFYRVFRRLANVAIPVDTGDFRLMDRKVVEAFGQLHERNRFVRGMISWTGFRQTTVRFRRDARLGGESKYRFFSRLRLAIDAICSMSVVPLRCVTYLGLLATALSLLFAITVVAQRLFFGLAIPGYALLTSGQFFLGSMNLLTLGVIGEYLARIYIEVQQRPLYLIRETEAAAREASKAQEQAVGRKAV